MIDALELLARRFWVGMWRIVPLTVVLGLALWGWFACTLSPIQRFYFPAYVGSSLHLVAGQEPDQVAWLVKTKPKDQIDFAEAEDLVPNAQGASPFAVSAHAVEQGWREVHALKPVSYQGGSQALILQNSFFEGRSLARLLLLPMEMLALPLSFWAVFVRWRYKRDQEEYEPSWAWVNGAWMEEGRDGVSDVLQFAREMTGHGAVVAKDVGRLLMQAERTGARIWRKRGSVSPSAVTIPMRQIERVTETKPDPFVSAPSLKPQAETLVASVLLPSPAQLETKSPAKLSRAQTLPFRKRQAEQRASEMKAAGESTESRGDAR